LVKGDDVTAAEIARIVLTARNDAIARLSLITTALAADPPQARPAQLGWLDEAEAADTPKHPELRTRLVLTLNPAPKP
jgi:hypothetical protein